MQRRTFLTAIAALGPAVVLVPGWAQAATAKKANPLDSVDRYPSRLSADGSLEFVRGGKQHKKAFKLYMLGGQKLRLDFAGGLRLLLVGPKKVYLRAASAAKVQLVSTAARRRGLLGTELRPEDIMMFHLAPLFSAHVVKKTKTEIFAFLTPKPKTNVSLVQALQKVDVRKSVTKELLFTSAGGDYVRKITRGGFVKVGGLWIPTATTITNLVKRKSARLTLKNVSATKAVSPALFKSAALTA